MENFRQLYKKYFLFAGRNLSRRYLGPAFTSYCDNLNNILSIPVEDITSESVLMIISEYYKLQIEDRRDIQLFHRRDTFTWKQPDSFFLDVVPTIWFPVVIFPVYISILCIATEITSLYLKIKEMKDQVRVIYWNMQYIKNTLYITLTFKLNFTFLLE